MIRKIVMQATPNDRKIVEEIIRNEFFSYIPLQHNKPLLAALWGLSKSIRSRKVITFTYQRQDGKRAKRS